MAHLSMTLLPFSNSHHWNIKEMATRRHNFVLASCLNKLYMDYYIFIHLFITGYPNYHKRYRHVIFSASINIFPGHEGPYFLP